MSFVAVIGGVSAIGGAMIASSATEKASDAQTASNNKSLALQQDQFEFEKQRYDDWKAVYGTLQEDLGTYYQNVTGASLSKFEIENLQLASQKAQDKISTTLAQRGMQGSGVEAQLLGSNIYNTEIAKATVASTADQRAADLKQNFLSIGLGSGNTIANSMAQTSSNMSQIYTHMGNNAITAGQQQASNIMGVANSLCNYAQQAYNNYNNQSTTDYDIFSRSSRG